MGPFVLMTPSGPARSRAKGALGGNRKLRIYGRLDCRSARRHLARGHYAAVRVFFRDKATAVACGYRPCGVCMPGEYAAWLARQDAQDSRALPPSGPLSTANWPLGAARLG